MIPKLFYAGSAGDGFGWGVCNSNLIRELGNLVELVDEPSNECIVFQPIADNALNPSTDARGWKNIGYTFFEFPLEPKAAENAKQYDLIFCGSTWCQERLKERGIDSKVLIQGVDHSIFHPGEGRPADGETWIFSGGKFEYRKGQDLVLAAFKEVLKTHPKTRLITAWQNPFPATMDSMAQSSHIKLPIGASTDPWARYLGLLCEVNDIPKDRVMTLPGLIPNAKMADIYRQCDFGVFPNRCEGGTNLVMMEFMACGRAVVATGGTGHADVLCQGMTLIHPRFDAQRWNEPRVEDVVEALSEALKMNRLGILDKMGKYPANAMRQWTWERAARTIVENL